MKPMPSIAAAIVVLASGCYLDRLTDSYDTASDSVASEEFSAILEESGRDAETARRHEERLRQLAEEAEPVYKMNAGDTIEIRVYGHDDLGMLTKIGPDGTVGIAFMGQVRLSGCSISEGAETIRKGLAPYVKNPVVSIAVKEVISETATIAGACTHPGVFGISNGTRLADLYAMAGASAERLFNGVEMDIADLTQSIVVRKGEILPVDFQKAINMGDPLHNIRIRRGDYVYIAQRMEASITICGEVRNPHKRMLEPNLSLLEALTAAGWMLDTHWKHVIIIRDGLANPRMYKVDVDGILAGKCRNVRLKAGDIIYVPKDDISEYNVFVRKLLPTAQLFNLFASRISTVDVE